MAIADNKDVVRAFMAAQTNGDAAAARRLLRDDLTFHVPVSGEKVMGIPTLTRGADSYMETRQKAVGKIYKSHARNIEMICFIAEDDFVAAFYRMNTDLAAGGAYENTYVFIYRLKDGKIAEIWENVDTAYSFMQFGFSIAKK
jgi:ketosteroid isomerase-like protein